MDKPANKPFWCFCCSSYGRRRITIVFAFVNNSGQSDSESSDDDDESDKDDDDVDEQFRNKVKDALGGAAVNSDEVSRSCARCKQPPACVFGAT